MKFKVYAVNWNLIARDERLRLFFRDHGVKFKFSPSHNDFEIDDSDDFPCKVSVEIELNDLNSLIEFINYVDEECIITPKSFCTDDKDPTVLIEIYNDYIE